MSNGGDIFNMLSESDLANANYEFLEIGDLLCDVRISDIYQDLAYAMGHTPGLESQIERFVNTYGPLGILQGVLAPLFMLDLPLQDLETVKQFQVLRPDQYLLRKYRIDASHSDFYVDPTFYSKNTTEIQADVEMRQSIRADALEGEEAKYGENPPVMRIERLMSVFFPNDSDKALKSLCGGALVKDVWGGLYHEPLELFLLCAKLNHQLMDGIGYFLKEYDDGCDDIIA